VNERKLNLDEFKIWNRKILNAYWIVLLLLIIGQVIFLFLGPITMHNQTVIRFLIRYMLIPDSIIIAILLVSEFWEKNCKKSTNYIILFTSIAISYTVFYNISYRLATRQIVLIFPLFISLLYFNRKILISTFSANLLIAWIMYFISPDSKYSMSIFDLIVFTIGSISAVMIGIGIVGRGIYLVKSIIDLVKNEERLIIEKSIIDKLSKTDALTGMYNHRTFHEYLDTLLTQYNSSNIEIQLAIIDIDNFKQVNDTYGHWSGDIVLKEVASIIQKTITADDFAARYGGEEFGVIFIGKNEEDTLKILENIREIVSKKGFSELNDKSVTVSIGIHNYLDTNSKEVIFRCADTALYKAKTSGKNKIVCSA
jgi:two-component system cell cycle response regulator